MRTITRWTWSYQGAETDAMRCFVGTGATLADAVGTACARAYSEGWDVIGHGLASPLMLDGMRVQVEAQREEWLVTLFVTDAPVEVPS